MTSVLSLYQTAIAGIKKSAVLEKYAEQDSSALSLKSGHDFALFQILKTAGIGDALKTVAGHVPESMRKGLGYGAGAAIPAAVGGGLLINQAGNESRETVEDARNKALQAALGIGTIGAGLYGLHRATSPDTKTAAVDTGADDILCKLATVGYLDTFLDTEAQTTADSDVRRKLAECRMLNAEHGVQLLRELLS